MADKEDTQKHKPAGSFAEYLKANPDADRIEPETLERINELRAESERLLEGYVDPKPAKRAEFLRSLSEGDFESLADQLGF